MLTLNPDSLRLALLLRRGDELLRLLEAAPSLKPRTALATAYAVGLRASEGINLSVFWLIPSFATIYGLLQLEAVRDDHAA